MVVVVSALARGDSFSEADRCFGVGVQGSLLRPLGGAPVVLGDGADAGLHPDGARGEVAGEPAGPQRGQGSGGALLDRGGGQGFVFCADGQAKHEQLVAGVPDHFRVSVGVLQRRRDLGFPESDAVEVGVARADGIDRELTDASNELLEIHRAAEKVFNKVMAGDRDTVRELLTAAARAPVDDTEPEHGPRIGAAWHDQLEEFTRQCRLGILANVVVDESPQGPGLNIRG
jgi:hypothetical protein